MKRTHHTGMVEGVGTAVGAVILASVGFLAGCAPGTICDKPGYESECLTGGSGGSASGSGGSGGSTSSGTGGSGGMPAATGGMGGSTPTQRVTCKLWPTKEEVAEKLVVPKCGMPGNVACHAVTFPPKFTNSAEAVMVMLDKAPTLYCRRRQDDQQGGSCEELHRVQGPRHGGDGRLPDGRGQRRCEDALHASASTVRRRGRLPRVVGLRSLEIAAHVARRLAHRHEGPGPLGSESPLRGGLRSPHDGAN